MKIISIQLVLFFLFNHANADDNFIKGKELFLSNKSACVSCHYISSLDDKNKKGMNLGKTNLDLYSVISIISEGKGVMPSYSNILSYSEIKKISYFIIKSAGFEIYKLVN